MKFEIYREGNAGGLLGLAAMTGGTKGLWRWRLVGSNGEPLAQGEDYVSKSDCEHAIHLLKSTTVLTPVFEV